MVSTTWTFKNFNILKAQFYKPLSPVLILSFHVIFFNIKAADQSKVMQDQMSGAAMAMPPDPKAAFKAEWEALEITEHRWALANVEADILKEKAWVDFIYINFFS